MHSKQKPMCINKSSWVTHALLMTLRQILKYIIIQITFIWKGFLDFVNVPKCKCYCLHVALGARRC